MDTIQIVAEIEIKQAYRDELIPVFQALVTGSRSEPGNKRYDLTEDIARSGHFFVLEEWLSAKAIEEHNVTPHFQNFIAKIAGKAEKVDITKVKSVFGSNV